MEIFLKPGEVCISQTPTEVSTILGSCVAVTIFNKRLKVGAICHALLPKNPDNFDTFRYVDSTVSYMLRRVEAMGIAKAEMEVKIFGGADVLGRNASGPSVGRKNVEIALAIMKQESLTPAITDTGGSLGRKIRFYTHTGEVLLKRLRRFQP